jgi:hypothetical protein
MEDMSKKDLSNVVKLKHYCYKYNRVEKDKINRVYLVMEKGE